MKWLYIFIAVFLFSCYSRNKAQTQFGKAAITYPEIPANYCSITFPPKIVTVKGDSIVVVDTLVQTDVITDTVRNLDTIRITRTLPGHTIIKTVHITDTITVENTAQLKLCELERGKVVDLLTSANLKLTSAQGKANKRGIIMWSLIGLIIVYSAWKVYGLFKPKIKI